MTKQKTNLEFDKLDHIILLVALLVFGTISHAQHAPGQGVTVTPRSKGCPITAVKVTPHVYMFRMYDSICVKYSGGACVETKRGEGWTRSNRMALDITVKNVGDRDIAALTFHIADRSTGLAEDWDDIRVNLKPGESTSLFYPSGNYRLIDVGRWRDKSVMVELYGLRYGDGEIVSTSCGLGSAPIPEAFQPVKANPDSPVYEGRPDSPPRVLESYYLPQTASGKVTHTAVFSLVVGEDGLPRNVKLISGTLGGDWDNKEIELLQKWNFGPATKDDKPVAWRINVTIHYIY